MKQLEEYITVGAKRMRCGYTTGTCAAAATRAAAELLLRGEFVPAVTVATPAGIDVVVEVEQHESGAGWAQCAVRKDAGDDPDVTDGVLVYARVEGCAEAGVTIDGGVGVGRVTREGLDQPVGAAAINSTPRKMIAEQVNEALDAVGGLHEILRLRASCSARDSMGQEAPARDGMGQGAPARGGMGQGAPARDGMGQGASSCHPERRPQAGVEGSHAEDAGAQAGLLVTISIPEGVELAARTFNPRLGIEGGISVIGTSGIVRPMSEDALVASIELEMRMVRARGAQDLLVVPGNYGRDFAQGQLGLSLEDSVQCSNYIGATLDAARVLGFERLLVVGHIGKMAKVAGGIMNTHSRVADCRLEVLAAHAALAGADRETVARVMAAATTDAAIDVLGECGLVKPVMKTLVASLSDRLAHRAGPDMQAEAIVFSNVHGVLGATLGANDLAAVFQDPGV